VAKQSRENK